MIRTLARVLPLLACLSAGCATVLSGTSGPVRVSSTPSGATVTLLGTDYQTPAQMTLSTKQSYVMTIHKDGYLSVRRAVCRVGNTVSTGNLLVGGAVGILADQSTGAAFLLYPTAIQAELPPSTPAERTYNRSR